MEPAPSQVYVWPKDSGDIDCHRCGRPVHPGDRVCLTGPTRYGEPLPAHERCETRAVGFIITTRRAG